MGSSYSVRLPAVPNEVAADELEMRILAAMQRIDSLMSTYKPESELSRFNRAPPGSWFPAAAETVDTVAVSLEISRRTGGRFDVTLGPLVNLWGFGPDRRPPLMPPAAEIAAARQRVGHEYLRFRRDPAALYKTRDLYVDLSSLAKGQAVDLAAEAAEAAGIQNYLIELGGEMRVRGLNEKGLPWRLAIEKPLPLARSGFRVLQMTEGGIATSGDYRNYFVAEGQRFSHIIDPVTASPVRHQLASVTVVHASARMADAWATALLVAGPGAGFALAEKEGLAALFITRAGDGFRESFTRGFRPLLAPEEE